MNRIRSSFLSRFALAFLPLAAAADEPAKSPIRIDLVSEAKAITPGRTFTVAIRQRMKPGYHTYWRNPGTVGLATSMDWRLPEGFKAGPLQWQLPQITTMAAYTVWGYEKEALILADITPPKSLKPGDQVVIKGNARWMCCGRQCHPGFEELRLNLPVAAEPGFRKRLKSAFDRVRAQQPQQSDAWKLTCSADGDELALHITPTSPAAIASPGEIRFFDYDRQVSSDKPQVLKRAGKGFVLKLEAEEYTPDQLNRLRGILVSKKGWETGQPGVVLAVDTRIAR